MTCSIIGPTIWKSEYYARSYFKPNGISGDYRIVEMMYDIENAHGRNPCRSPIENLLESCFATIHSVVGIWERRHWIAHVLLRAYKNHPKLVISDIACGGARYLFDFLRMIDKLDGIEVLLFNQDISAIGPLKEQIHKMPLGGVNIILGPILELDTKISCPSTCDFVISAVMHDYLEQSMAIRITRKLAKMLKPNGELLITNYHKSDPSRLPKVWGANWPLVFKDEDDFREIAARSKLKCNIEYSTNLCLMMCKMSKQEPGIA